MPDYAAYAAALTRAEAEANRLHRAMTLAEEALAAAWACIESKNQALDAAQRLIAALDTEVARLNAERRP